MPSRDLRRSPAYTGIPEPHYPFHNLTDMITSCGRICLYRKKIWLVSFMDYDLGYVDLEERTLQPLENPFEPKVLPMS
jgi:hypothetical protein